LISDDEFSPERLEEIVALLLEDPERLESMSSAASAAGHRDAAERVAALVESVGKEWS